MSFIAVARRLARKLARRDAYRRRVARRAAQHNPRWIEQLEPRKLLANITVDVVADVVDGIVTDGNISLREAINIANSNNMANDTITLNVAGPFNLGIATTNEDANVDGDLDITMDNGAPQTITIVAPNGAIIDRLGVDRVFDVLAGNTLNLPNITIQDSSMTAVPVSGGLIQVRGNATVNTTGTFIQNSSVSGGNTGGAVFVQPGGTLNVNGGLVQGNNAFRGGAIYNIGGTVNISGAAGIQNNSAVYTGGAIHSVGYYAGAVYAPATVTITGGAVVQNNMVTAAANFGGGGGIFTDGNNLPLYGGLSSLTVTGSTISGNSVVGNMAPGGFSSGGGILNGFNYGTVTINGGSTISGNSAGYGGGIETRSGTTTVTGSTISTNTATYQTGGGISNVGGTVNINGSTITGNTAQTNGGGIRNNGYLVNIGPDNSGGAPVNSSITNNVATNGHGGGIFNQFNAYGTVALNSASITGNSAAMGLGGGIYNAQNASINDLNSTIGGAGALANVATNGGGIANGRAAGNSGGTVTLNGTTVTGNSATVADGGGIIQYGSAVAQGMPGSSFVTLVGATVSGNNAVDDGGGIYNVYGMGAINVTMGSVISGNNALGDDGGGIWNAAILNVNTGSRIIGNTTSNDGAGVYNDGNGVATIDASFIGGAGASEPNIAGDDGGGIFNDANATLTISGGTVISSNVATNDGGGIQSDGTLTVTGSTITLNRANNDDGGGIHSDAGTVALTSSMVTNNSAGDNGGGIYAYSTMLTITGSTISGNSAADAGGGVYLYGNGGTITNSTISGNTAGDDGGGIESIGNLVITNSTISGNSAGDEGGGINRSLGTLTLNNSTVTLNYSISRGGGVDGSVTAENSVIAGNTSALPMTGDDVNGTVTTTTFSFVGVTDATFTGAGGGTILNGDPMLQATLTDNGGPTLTHAPLTGSPLIDAGMDATATGVDQRNSTGLMTVRPVDVATIANAAGGDGSDIGAVELQQADVGIAITQNPPSGMVAAGQILVHNVTVTNNGVSGVDNLVVNVPLTQPAGVSTPIIPPNVANPGVSVGTFDGFTQEGGTDTWTIGSLAPGATATLGVLFTIDSSATPAANAISIMATVNSVFSSSVDLGDPNAANDMAVIATTILPPQVPDLAVTVSDGDISTAPGGTVVYTISHNNTNGVVPSTGVMITETLPAGSTFNAAMSSPGWVNNMDGTFSLAVPDLAAGASGADVMFAVDVANPVPGGQTQLSNTVSIADDLMNGVDPNMADNMATDTTPIILVDLAVAVAESTAGVVAGSGAGNLVYTVTVTNNGPSDATGVMVSNLLNLVSGVSVDSIDVDTGVDPADQSNANWNLGNLASGATATLTATLTVDGTASEGTGVISNTASVTATDQTLINTLDDMVAEATNIVAGGVDVMVTQTESIDPVVAGSGTGNLVYSISVMNNGPADATNVDLSNTLTLPSGVTIDVAGINQSTGSVGVGGSNVAWQFNLDNGATATIDIPLTVDATADAGTDVITSAPMVTGADQALINTSDDSAEDSTSVLSPPPVADAGGPYTVDEGDTVQLDASGTTDGNQDPATLDYAWDFDDDGLFDDATGINPTFDAGGIDGPASIEVEVQVTDDTGQMDTSTSTVTVNNVAPSIDTLDNSATVFGATGAGQNVTLNGTFSDSGAPETHTAEIDWGDGTIEPATITGNSISGTHAYANGGIFDITVTLTDGEDTDTSTTQAVVSGVALNNGVLQVVGSNENDSVAVSLNSRTNSVKVTSKLLPSRFLEFPVAQVQSIEMSLGGGNDRTNINRKILVPVEVDGGDGNDRLKGAGGDVTLIGGNGDDSLTGGLGDSFLDGGEGKDRLKGGSLDSILIGGPGDDKLTGGKVDNLIIGGDGNDSLKGGRGDNVLIGGNGEDRMTGGRLEDLLLSGSTTLNQVELESIFAEWASSKSFAERVDNIMGVGSGGLNGTAFLIVDTTAFDDFVQDRVNGGSGGDWLIATLPDRITGRAFAADASQVTSKLDLLTEL